MTWKIINELLCRDNKKSSSKRKETIVHNDKTYETNKDISMIFNSFYKNIAVDIAKDLKSTGKFDGQIRWLKLFSKDMNRPKVSPWNQTNYKWHEINYNNELNLLAEFQVDLVPSIYLGSW